MAMLNNQRVTQIPEILLLNPCSPTTGSFTYYVHCIPNYIMDLKSTCWLVKPCAGCAGSQCSLRKTSFFWFHAAAASIPIWLVVYLPLWKIWESVGIMTFPINMESHKSHVPVTTKQIIVYNYMLYNPYIYTHRNNQIFHHSSHGHVPVTTSSQIMVWSLNPTSRSSRVTLWLVAMATPGRHGNWWDLIVV